jgi:hypothetical protein
MGRPPIGKVAMTGAERVRRYREKHGIDKRQHSDKVSLQTFVTKRLQREVDALRSLPNVTRQLRNCRRARLLTAAAARMNCG